MGLDITLMQFQAYETSLERLVTVSQLLPLQEIEDFTVTPRSSISPADVVELPIVPWTTVDLRQLDTVLTNPGVRMILDLSSQRPGEAVTYSEAVETSKGRGPQLAADLAGFTHLVKRRFGRSNWPFTHEWSAELSEATYTMDLNESEAWLAATTSTQSRPVDSEGTDG